MSKIVFLLEEESMGEFLRIVLSRIFPEKNEGLDWHLIPFGGKKTLERKIASKIAGWREPDTRFFIICDKDNEDCRELKCRLLQFVPAVKRAGTVVRIACEELESWYFADIEKLAAEYNNPDLKKITKNNDADSVIKPSRKLDEHIERFNKRDAAKRMGKIISVEPTTNSCSYNHLLKSIRNLITN